MSQIRVNDITDSGGSWSSTPQQISQGRAKAWVNFNGQGTVSIRDDYNVNTISDNGTGIYTVNFSSSMPNANYSTTAQVRACGIVAGLYIEVVGNSTCGAPTTSSTTVRVITSGGSLNDSNYVYITINGD